MRPLVLEHMNRLGIGIDKIAGEIENFFDKEPRRHSLEHRKLAMEALPAVLLKVKKLQKAAEELYNDLYETVSEAINEDESVFEDEICVLESADANEVAVRAEVQNVLELEKSLDEFPSEERADNRRGAATFSELSETVEMETSRVDGETAVRSTSSREPGEHGLSTKRGQPGRRSFYALEWSPNGVSASLDSS